VRLKARKTSLIYCTVPN